MAFFICQACGTEYEAPEPKCPACGRTETIRLNRTDRMVDKVIGGRYRLIKKVGQGGMGAVYLAEQIGIGHRVAIKFLKTEFSNDVEIARRFLNEAKTYAKVSHPHAVTFHEFGQDEEGNLFIAMEYCEGVDLKKTIAERGRLAVAEAIDVVSQVADVLADAHQKQIVHRDLKPENIMIRTGLRGMHAKVLDFGIARLLDASTQLTAVGAIAGTPRYMSPEQVNGQPVDIRADVYALGIVCFEALTGRQPFDGNTIAEIMRKQVMDPLPRLASLYPDLDLPPLQAVLDKACAKRRDDRFPDMIAFANALTSAIPTQVHLSLPPIQRLATEASRASVMATPLPGRQAGVAVPGTLAGNDSSASTMLRTPEPNSTVPDLNGGGPGPTVGSISPRASVAPVGDVSLPPQAPARSKGPLIGVGVVLVVLISAVGYALWPKPPPPKPPDPPPLEKVEIAQPEVPKPPPVDQLALADAAMRMMQNQQATNFLGSARAHWDKGELEPATIDLKSINEGTAPFAEAQKMLDDIKRVTEAIAAGDAKRQSGHCDQALDHYRRAQKINAAVPAVAAGLRECRAGTISPHVE